jgi:hypothetical protein
MMEGTMHQPETTMNVLSPDSVKQKEYQPYNITLDAQYMFYKGESKTEGKQESGMIEQGLGST